MEFSPALNRALSLAFTNAKKDRHEFVTPEHILFYLLDSEELTYALQQMKVDIDGLRSILRDYFKSLPPVPKRVKDFHPSESQHLAKFLIKLCINAQNSETEHICISHFIATLLDFNECYGSHALMKLLTQGGELDPNTVKSEFLSNLQFIERAREVHKKHNHITEEEEHFYNDEDEDDDEDEGEDDINGFLGEIFSRNPNDDADDYDDSDDDFFPEGDFNPFATGTDEEAWKNFVTDLTDEAKGKFNLVGRENEINRILQVLCRKEKSNVLQIGDPGVGKSAIMEALARRFKSGDVPERLKGYKIYQINIADLLAGTQYRGDFEKRIKMVMGALQEQKKVVVYIDEFHSIMGAGSNQEHTIDAASLLRPYFEDNSIHFIGATTFTEYKRSLANSRSIMRHFQQVEIIEPSVDESIQILMKRKAEFERFHGVKYSKDVIEYAVKASARYIHDRALPDKAIDLIDEAGSYATIHPDCNSAITKDLIARILAKICKVDHISDIDIDSDDDNNEVLNNLYDRISSQIYGQDEAVRKVVEAVQMSRAGLLDNNKPTASLLFVGPTGVGKTEVTRVLARELSLPLVRFDMSEYAEKHTVAKLIGSPAGYIGYDDGGLLTDAIRKTPNCVLLLDEIEKAHSDIYNLLLQVMDYASLTDNKGIKVDFSHVILIMTSNAGAQHSGSSVGFVSNTSRGSAMMKAVKATFKPEFLNRLSGTVVFNDMDRKMAELIFNKKIKELQNQLAIRKITLSLTKEASNLLISKGFTPEYGARELDRVISQMLKPMLMRDILFGALKKGGKATVDQNGSGITIHSTAAKARTTNKNKQK